jgi:hypothetical protein
MNRRTFLRSLGLIGAVAVVAPKVLLEEPKKEPVDGTILYLCEDVPRNYIYFFNERNLRLSFYNDYIRTLLEREYRWKD